MKARRIILIVLVTVGITAFLSSFVLFQMLERSSPATPVAAAQQVCQLNSHGHFFYVTREQYWFFYTLLCVGWVLGALAALMNLRWKVIHNLTPQGWRLPK